MQRKGRSRRGPGPRLAPAEGRTPSLSLEELEAAFADRDTLAAETYTLGVLDQTNADLAEATSNASATFEGFSGDGVWLLELREDNTLLPVPIFFAVVNAE